MAVWGTPVAVEGDVERAVRAGLDLVGAVADLGAELGVPGLAARAGVVTGEVAVTLGATGEGMVAGDAVNTAARVQAAAGPGTVLADGATQRLAGSAIGFADAGEHALKGKAGPQRLWRATRVLAGVGGSQRVDGLEAPLTGRDAELRTVKELFHAAAGRRVPRLVLVSGPAGVGKSRLGREFEKYLDGLVEDVWWHRGLCLSYGDGVAFWALAEIVRQRLSIAEEDPAEAAAGKLAAGLAEFVPDPAERAYAGVRLGRLPGMPGPARAKITAQAQGIPLFGVETIRSLIDRDVVQPVEGIYRLVGDVGHLAVPDSLHALLAARLDALDRGARRLVADAAVLGSTFPAEALIAVSGQDEPVVRAALDELVRREVLSVSDGYTRRRHRAGLITEGGVESGRPQPSRRFRHFG